MNEMILSQTRRRVQTRHDPPMPTPDSIAAARAAQDYGRDLAARQIFGDPDGTEARVWLARISAVDRGVA